MGSSRALQHRPTKLLHLDQQGMKYTQIRLLCPNSSLDMNRQNNRELLNMHAHQVALPGTYSFWPGGTPGIACNHTNSSQPDKTIQLTDYTEGTSTQDLIFKIMRSNYLI